MLRIYDSLRRTVVPFETLQPGKVSMYVCGQTVYDAPHLGHARKDVGFDVVVRWLEASGYSVTYVRNITDIDDKIMDRARANGEPIGDLTQRMIDVMSTDFADLNLRRPDHEPRATEFVPQMIDMISELEQAGLAYAAGDVFYAVRRFNGYGKLSGRSPDEMRAGERVSVDPNKRDALDFVLWKRSKPEDPPEARWPAPWGEGRPGWHLECSTMVRALLGKTIDIHGGGPDLRFPHHENEIAQSEAANQVPLARWWMHVGQLNMGIEKMSKSLGNFVPLRDALERYGGDVLRFFFVRTHYRSPIVFSEASLVDAAQSLDRLRSAMRLAVAEAPEVDWDSPHAARFQQAMDDDFNSALAVAVLFDVTSEVHRTKSQTLAGELWALSKILGISRERARTQPMSDYAAIEALVAARDLARSRRDFAEADRIRDQLTARGIVIEDGTGQTRWRLR